MAKQTAGFVDQHIEKVVAGVVGIAFIGALVYSFGGSRFAVGDRTPSQLVEQAGTAANNTARAVESARARSQEGSTDDLDQYIEALDQWFAPSGGLIKVAELAVPLSPTQPFQAPLVSPLAGAGQGKVQMASFVAPEVPIVTAGRVDDIVLETNIRNVFGAEEKYSADGGGIGEGFPTSRRYASVAGQVDLVDQLVAFDQAGYPEAMMVLPIVQVHLQRKNVNDPGSIWEDVQMYLSYQPIERPQSAGNTEAIASFRETLTECPNACARPKLPSRRAELPAVPYLVEPPQRVIGITKTREDIAKELARDWLSTADKARRGRRPFDAVDLHAALVNVRAVLANPQVDERDRKKAEDMQKDILAELPKAERQIWATAPRAPERLMPVMAHDLTVIPGETYIYRIRYEVMNILAGLHDQLVYPDDAERITLFSEWSSPSRPVKVEEPVVFFLTEADADKNQATIVVFRETRAGVLKRDYRITPGDPIGKNERNRPRGDFTTNTLCIDIDFDRNVDGQKTVALVYLDSVDGNLRERYLARDQTHPEFQRLSTKQ